MNELAIEEHAEAVKRLEFLTTQRADLADALRRLGEAKIPLEGAADHGVSEAIYLRDPRRLLLCSGPPVESDSDAEMTDILLNFKGRKVICGATTSEIISNHSGIAIIDGQEFDDPELPPISFMKGIDLVTEGILTLSKVALLLRNYQNSPQIGKGPADQVVKLLLESDEIHLLIGMRINQAHHVPGLPLELEVRPTVARRIARLSRVPCARPNIATPRSGRHAMPSERQGMSPPLCRPLISSNMP